VKLIKKRGEYTYIYLGLFNLVLHDGRITPGVSYSKIALPRRCMDLLFGKDNYVPF